MSDYSHSAEDALVRSPQKSASVHMPVVPERLKLKSKREAQYKGLSEMPLMKPSGQLEHGESLRQYQDFEASYKRPRQILPYVMLTVVIYVVRTYLRWRCGPERLTFLWFVVSVDRGSERGGKGLGPDAGLRRCIHTSCSPRYSIVE